MPRKHNISKMRQLSYCLILQTSLALGSAENQNLATSIKKRTTTKVFHKVKGITNGGNSNYSWTNYKLDRNLQENSDEDEEGRVSSEDESEGRDAVSGYYDSKWHTSVEGDEDSDASSWGWGWSTSSTSGSDGASKPALVHPKPKPAPKPKLASKPKPKPKPKPSSGTGSSGSDSGYTSTWEGWENSASSSATTNSSWGADGSWDAEPTSTQSRVESTAPVPTPTISVEERVDEDTPSPVPDPTPSPTKKPVSGRSDETCDCDDYPTRVCNICDGGSEFCPSQECAAECCVKKCFCNEYDDTICDACLGDDGGRCPDVQCAEDCCFKSYTYTAEGDSYKEKHSDDGPGDGNRKKYGYDADSPSYKAKYTQQDSAQVASAQSSKAQGSVPNVTKIAMLIGVVAIVVAAVVIRRHTTKKEGLLDGQISAGDDYSTSRHYIPDLPGGSIGTNKEVNNTELGSTYSSSHRKSIIGDENSANQSTQEGSSYSSSSSSSSSSEEDEEDSRSYRTGDSIDNSTISTRASTVKQKIEIV